MQNPARRRADGSGFPGPTACCSRASWPPWRRSRWWRRSPWPDPRAPRGSQTRSQLGDGNKVFLVGHGVGVQIYTCNGSAWSSAVPRANLYDDNGKLIITHFAGPTWQAKDGSKAVGTVVDKVILDQTAIAWVLLSATTTPGPDGDRLVDTTFIQRIDTAGGLTPPCRGLQRGNGRHRGRGPVHGRVRLLEAHRCLSHGRKGSCSPGGRSRGSASRRPASPRRLNPHDAVAAPPAISRSRVSDVSEFWPPVDAGVSFGRLRWIFVGTRCGTAASSR